jgi:hypothetical protein
MFQVLSEFWRRMSGFDDIESLAGISTGASARTTRLYRSYNTTKKPEIFPENSQKG